METGCGLGSDRYTTDNSAQVKKAWHTGCEKLWTPTYDDNLSLYEIKIYRNCNITYTATYIQLVNMHLTVTNIVFFYNLKANYITACML